MQLAQAMGDKERLAAVRVGCATERAAQRGLAGKYIARRQEKLPGQERRRKMKRALKRKTGKKFWYLGIKLLDFSKE